ncbi:carbonic anhydrase family protein [Flavobacterium sp. 81]|uniref:carbonic anhydrase family protein n=1 Tax=Flavobacterium sp. 81 TaxID=2135621 RepID=UPI002100FD3B|nr:carbonic anhydrase family protein [Flavobacterium sp. 81]
MKRITAKILLGSVLMMFVACSDKNNTKEEEKKHWNYEGETGPEHWSEIDQNDCGGSAQSPIDIINTETDKTLLPIDFHYNEKTKIHDIINNGHSIQVDFEPDDYIMINGDKYELKQFHFHEPAETYHSWCKISISYSYGSHEQRWQVCRSCNYGSGGSGNQRSI